jgi:hypothetical protein
MWSRPSTARVIVVRVAIDMVHLEAVCQSLAQPFFRALGMSLKGIASPRLKCVSAGAGCNLKTLEDGGEKP